MKTPSTSEKLFTRDGMQFQAQTFHYNDKGQPYYTIQTKCSRCGGLGGGSQWAHTGWTCYQCGGSGKGPVETLRLYTETQLQKLDATKAKAEATRKAKKAAEVALREAERASKREAFLLTVADLFTEAKICGETGFVTDVIATATEKACLTDRQREAIEKAIARAKENSHVEYLGTIGQRLEFKGTVKMVRSFQTVFGTKYIFLVLVGGGLVKYMGTSYLGGEGEVITFKAKIDGYEEYNGTKQTLVSRPTTVKTV